MANKITYQWTIPALDCAVSKDGLTNVIETIHWRYRGTNKKGVTAEMYGAQSVGDPNPEDFTPFEEIKKEKIVEWLESIMDMKEIQTNINTQIKDLENPTHVTLQLPIEEVQETVEEIEDPTQE